MTYYSRIHQQDLSPLASRMAHEAAKTFTEVWKTSGRAHEDLAAASVLAAALLGAAARQAGEIPVSAWAEANQLAQNPSSLLQTMPFVGQSNISHG